LQPALQSKVQKIKIKIKMQYTLQRRDSIEIFENLTLLKKTLIPVSAQVSPPPAGLGRVGLYSSLNFKDCLTFGSIV